MRRPRAKQALLLMGLCILLLPGCQQRARGFDPETYEGDVTQLPEEEMRQRRRSANPWHSRLNQWATPWARIASEARKVRYLKFANKYQQQADLWNRRADAIIELPPPRAETLAHEWMNELPVPATPTNSPGYFRAKDAFELISVTHDKLLRVKQWRCLGLLGTQRNYVIAFLTYAIDLYHAKNYYETLRQAEQAEQRLDNALTRLKECTE